MGGRKNKMVLRKGGQEKKVVVKEKVVVREKVFAGHVKVVI